MAARLCWNYSYIMLHLWRNTTDEQHRQPDRLSGDVKFMPCRPWSYHFLAKTAAPSTFFLIWNTFCGNFLKLSDKIKHPIIFPNTFKQRLLKTALFVRQKKLREKLQIDWQLSEMQNSIEDELFDTRIQGNYIDYSKNIRDLTWCKICFGTHQNIGVRSSERRVAFFCEKCILLYPVMTICMHKNDDFYKTLWKIQRGDLNNCRWEWIETSPFSLEISCFCGQENAPPPPPPRTFLCASDLDVLRGVKINLFWMIQSCVWVQVDIRTG